jgi:hypothetical protein
VKRFLGGGLCWNEVRFYPQVHEDGDEYDRPMNSLWSPALISLSYQGPLIYLFGKDNKN